MSEHKDVRTTIQVFDVGKGEISVPCSLCAYPDPFKSPERDKVHKLLEKLIEQQQARAMLRNYHFDMWMVTEDRIDEASFTASLAKLGILAEQRPDDAKSKVVKELDLKLAWQQKDPPVSSQDWKALVKEIQDAVEICRFQCQDKIFVSTRNIMVNSRSCLELCLELFVKNSEDDAVA